MVLTLRNVLLLIAVVLFILAALGINLGPISLLAAGLAFFAGAFVAPDVTLGGGRRF